MKRLSMWVAGAALLCLAPACGPSGTPGVSGEITLDEDVIVDQERATRIFVGAYGAEQLSRDGWPETWSEAKSKVILSDMDSKPYHYSMLTASSERLYIYAFLDNNGLLEDPPVSEPSAIKDNETIYADVAGSFAKNPVVPIDDMLVDIDIVLRSKVEYIGP